MLWVLLAWPGLAIVSLLLRRVCRHGEPYQLTSQQALLLVVMGEMAVREMERDVLAPGTSSMAPRRQLDRPSSMPGSARRASGEHGLPETASSLDAEDWHSAPSLAGSVSMTESMGSALSA